GGVALILHTLAMLKAMDYRGYGTLTVVINGDEEISSPGARAFIQRAGAEHDFVFSCEPSLATKAGEIALATSGIGQATLTVRGKSAHAGVNPELGRNAIVELAHQILQTTDLSDAGSRIKFNWTLASVQLNLMRLPASDRSVVCRIWCASSTIAFLPSSGFTPACADLPRTVSVAWPMPLVASAISPAFVARLGSQEKTKSCSAPARWMNARAPGELISSSPLITTVSVP